jgi:hypothetical protein
LKISEYRSTILPLVKPQIALNTYTSYKLAFDKWIQPMGDTELDTMTTQQVELFKNKALQKLTASAVSIYFRALKSQLNRGIQMGIVTANPFLKAKPVKIPQTPPDFLDDIEQQFDLPPFFRTPRKDTIFTEEVSTWKSIVHGNDTTDSSSLMQFG